MKKLWFILPNLCLMILVIVYSCKTSDSRSGSISAPDHSDRLSFLRNNKYINSALDSLVENELIPFGYVRIEDLDGATIYEHSAVNRELYPDLEVNKDSWFRLWSMSKIVTISLTMDLVEEGTLGLDEPVSKYIPEFVNLQVAIGEDGTAVIDIPWDEREKICPIQYVRAEHEMTIAHLIHHKAGFYYPWTNISCLDSIWMHQDLNAARNSQELINRLSDMPLVQHPGTGYHYGLNTTVLGLVAERATGNTLKRLVEERITGPLKIKNLQYTKPSGANLLPRTSGENGLVEVTAENENEILGAELPPYEPESTLYLGGEGMIGTTDGYADFMRMLLHGGKLNGHRLLDETTIAEMSAPHTQLDSPWGYNGYNLWVTGDTLQLMRIGEAGLWVSGGYEGTYCWIDRKRQFVGLVMTQLFNMNTAPSEVVRGAVYQEIWKHESE